MNKPSQFNALQSEIVIFFIEKSVSSAYFRATIKVFSVALLDRIDFLLREWSNIRYFFRWLGAGIEIT
jgi:hypothetical protein